MTLARAIKRREKRQRAKTRQHAKPGRTFAAVDWMMKESIDSLCRQIQSSQGFNMKLYGPF